MILFSPVEWTPQMLAQLAGPRPEVEMPAAKRAPVVRRVAKRAKVPVQQQVGAQDWTMEALFYMGALASVLRRGKKIRTMNEKNDHIEISAAEAYRIADELDRLIDAGRPEEEAAA
jgi:hypothetical protein